MRWDAEHGFHVPELAKVAAPNLQDMYKVIFCAFGACLQCRHIYKMLSTAGYVHCIEHSELCVLIQYHVVRPCWCLCPHARRAGKMPTEALRRQMGMCV